MKKTTFQDKLKLRRITVRLLSTKELKEAIGGAPTQEFTTDTSFSPDCPKIK
jgi:hypothetical protein